MTESNQEMRARIREKVRARARARSEMEQASARGSAARDAMLGLAGARLDSDYAAGLNAFENDEARADFASVWDAIVQVSGHKWSWSANDLRPLLRRNGEWALYDHKNLGLALRRFIQDGLITALSREQLNSGSRGNTNKTANRYALTQRGRQQTGDN